MILKLLDFQQLFKIEMAFILTYPIDFITCTGLQGLPTMLSTEIVKIINDMREEGAAVLRHTTFMEKVVKVLGEKDVQKFLHISKDAYGREKPCYALPKREANLMVMSESYKVQAAITTTMFAKIYIIAKKQQKYFLGGIVKNLNDRSGF